MTFVITKVIIIPLTSVFKILSLAALKPTKSADGLKFKKKSEEKMELNEKCLFLESLNKPGSLLVVESVITTVINLTFSLIAAASNGIIIITFWRTKTLRSPPHLLLLCLSFADLITGIIVQPFYGAFKITYLLKHYSLSCVFRVIMETVAWFSSALSCSLFTFIILERYLALKFHLRYQELITTKRVITFLVIYVVSIGGFSVSRLAMENSRPFIAISVIGILTALAILLICYCKIYQLVGHHHRQIRDQRTTTVSAQTDPHLKSLKKSVLNMAFVASLYMIAYLPFTCVLITYLSCGFTRNVEAAYDITRTVAFMASSWNPFLYCWKMADLREAVVKFLRKSQGVTTVEEL